MYLKCHACGWEAPEGARYRRVREGILLRRAAYCPRCWKERTRRRDLVLGTFLAVGVTVGLVLLLLLLYSDAGDSFLRFLGYVAAFLALFVVSAVAISIPHEFAHALAARWLGLRVFRIVFGHGRTVWAGSVWGFPTEVRSGGWGAGLTVFGHPNTRLLRWKQSLVILAGPLTHVALILVVAWGLFWPDPRPAFARWPLPLPGLAFLLANAGALLVVLVPISLRIGGEVHPSDGLQFLLTPFRSRASVRALHATYFAQEGDECLREKRPADALAWYRRGLEHYPDNPTNALGVGLALFQLGQLGPARAHLRAVLARTDLTPPVRAYLADTAGTVVLHLLMGQPAGEGPAPPREDLLEEGERYCREALDNAGGLSRLVRASFQGTLGCTLVEQGRYEEGVDLLRISLARLDEPQHRAYGFAYLAVAAARQGQRQQAGEFLETARRLAPDHPAVKRAERELGPGGSP